MIEIRITSPDVRELKGASKSTGKEYHLRFQTGYAFTVSKDGQVAEFPEKFEISLDKDQPAYSRGVYKLSPSAVYVNRDGRLDVSPRLVPVSTPAPAKA
jgi:Helix-destabilising protein